VVEESTGIAYHAEIPIIHVIVDSDPGPSAREQADHWSRGCPVDDNVLSALAGRRHIGEGHPENMIWGELIIVLDSPRIDGGGKQTPNEEGGQSIEFHGENERRTK
jgi:hypothetical protein